MANTKEIIRVLGFIQEYFDNHADEQEPDCRKELFRDWSEITLDAITLLKAQEQVEANCEHRCNKCKFYEGVHNVMGHAPCSLWKISGVMWNDYCSRFNLWKESEVETNREAIEILSELEKCYIGGIVDAIDLAIEALEAQEPHVLPLEELQSIGETWDKNTPPFIWVEILDAPEWYTDDEMWVPYSFIRDTINVGSEKYNKDSYMKNWRCWNKKPTDDQRNNTPFNESD